MDKTLGNFYTFYSGADTGFRRGGGARFLGTKPFTKFRNKSSKFRYKNRAKRDKIREAQKICARSVQKFSPPLGNFNQLFVPNFVPLGIL